MRSTNLEALKWVLMRAAIAAGLVVLGFASESGAARAAYKIMIMCGKIDFNRGVTSSGVRFVPRVVPGHGPGALSSGRCCRGGP